MLTPKIIYENADFLVVNKPAGLVMHAAKVNPKKRIDEGKKAEPTLVDWLLAHYSEIKSVGDDPALRPGIVHRLDKETSGIMLVARNQESFERLKKLFQDHAIHKTYLALVFGVPKNESGTIDAPIGIKNGTLKRSIRSEKMAKPAVTDYRVIKKFAASEENEKSFSLLEVKPKTGRTHQIRVHLASIGHPIVGDRLYGPKKAQPDFATRMMLHATSLEFSDEKGRRFEFEAPPPKDFGTIS
jgi:23S rRNA pseudouridine1911/1915/1917 synthase